MSKTKREKEQEQFLEKYGFKKCSHFYFHNFPSRNYNILSKCRWCGKTVKELLEEELGIKIRVGGKK